jgi:glycosyltransferase involved in cell wall biosynthesis
VDGPRAVSDLTVVIPVWGGYSRYLAGCLAAVRSQAVDARVIVVDNAAEPAIALLGGDVAVVRAPTRLSAGGARNFGLQHVDTEYVCFADVDDEPLPGAWRFLLDRLEQDRTLVACSGQLWWWNEQTGERRPAPSPRSHVYRHLSGRRRSFALYMLLRMALPTTTATIFRTSVAKDAGGYGDSSHAEDWVLAAAVALRGRVEQHRRPGALVRLHEGSLFNRAVTHGEVDAGMAALRARIAADRRAPMWIRMLLPAIAVFHAQKVKALMRREPETNPLQADRRARGTA